MATTNTDSDSVLLNQIVNQGVNIYGSREKIRSALIEYAKNYLNLQDADIKKTSYLAYLIDQISILTANHIFYDSTIYREFFFTEAQFNESVVNLAKWIGYSIPKAVPSQVEVMFTIPLKFTRRRVSFSLSPYFYVKTNDGIPFIIKSNSLDSSNAGTMNIDTVTLSEVKFSEDVIHGTVINNNVINLRDSDGCYRPIFVSTDKSKAYFSLTFIQKEIVLKSYEIPNDLAKNQFYSIDIPFNGQVCDIEVYMISPSYNQKLIIKGTSIDSITDASTFDPDEEIYDTAGTVCTWTKLEESVNGIYTMHSNSNQFSWIGGYNKGKLMFGNGILGKQPPPNSRVAVRLHVTKGTRGNVVAKTISTGDPIYSDYSTTTITSSDKQRQGETIKYSVMNPNSAYGGTDLLTLPEIKQNAIVNLSAKNRLVSDEDYNNIETIMGNDLPINDCYSILKRSDIKVNEIMAFTTLNYTNDNVNEIVPTRNARLKLKNIVFDDDGKYVLMRNTIVDNENSNVGNDFYYTMYNLEIDKNSLVANYDYVLQYVNGSTVKMYSRFKDNYYEQFTYMTGNGVDFTINTNRKAILNNNYNLDVTFNVNHVPEKNEGIDQDHMTAEQYFQWKVDTFQCKMITKWGNNDVYDCTSAYNYRYEKDEETGQYKSFGWTIDNYLNVPDGMQRFEFQLQCYAPYRDADGNILATDGSIAIKDGEDLSDLQKDEARKQKIIKMTWNNIRTYYTDIIIRRDLTDFMLSSISFEKSEEKLNVDQKVVSRITSREVYDNDGLLLLPKDHTITDDDYNDLFLKEIDTIWVYDGNTWCYVHNVPVVLKSYYDQIIQSDSNTGASNFELTVMQNLVSKIDFSDRKMLTDFVNIKFSDTYGPMYNLRYNNADYFVESRYDNTPWWNSETQEKPNDIIVNESYEKPEDNASGIYYIVNNVIPFDEGVKKTKFVNDYIGYIALRIVNGDAETGYTYTYQLIEPSRGMYIKVKDELDNEGYIKTLVWTGRSWKDISDYSIPLEIKMKVEVDETKVSKSDDTVRKEIIDALTTYFKEKIGIQKNIDRSEIVKVCRSITGITYAEIVAPEFDIRFDYEIKDLTQKQLIDFTPEYIGFRGKYDGEEDYSRSSIDIEIVRV